MRGLFLVILAAAAVVRGNLYRGPRFIDLGIVGILRPVTIGYNRETLSRLSAFDRLTSSSVSDIGPTFVASGVSGGSTIGPGPYLAGSSVTDVSRTIAPFSSGPLSGAVEAYEGIGPIVGPGSSGPYFDGPLDTTDGPDIGPLDGLSGPVSSDGLSVGPGATFGGGVTTVRSTRVSFPGPVGTYPEENQPYYDGPFDNPYDGLDSSPYDLGGFGELGGVGSGGGVGGGVTTVRTTRYSPGPVGTYSRLDSYDGLDSSPYDLGGFDGLDGVGSGVGRVSTVRRTRYTLPGVTVPSIYYTRGSTGGGNYFDLGYDFPGDGDYDRLRLLSGGSGFGGSYARDIQYSLGGRSDGYYINPYRFRDSGIGLRAGVGAGAGIGPGAFGDVRSSFSAGGDTSIDSAAAASGGVVGGLTSGSTSGSEGYSITDPRIMPNY
ncbi:uncharacterized protein LOC133192285 [Saccostrea echinata]|uniref:uncharacterized protein LOC133192285 n=1 Tax=Saccostrea echinata TaxID=191078 RepID=UPI002A7ED4B5|nr:uncharacterized protein LOC133192285 [Saccostrea echinata]